MAISCPDCKFDNSDDTFYCGKCGKTLPSSENPEIGQTRTIETQKDELATGALFAKRYYIIEELGEGGMGRVFLARDTKLDEEIALKLLKHEIAADKKALDRFSQELKIARNIVHKNVGRMYELMEAGDLHFITMEYVRGEDLKSLIKRTEKLTPSKAISIAHQICDGMNEAHSLGIVHRDLKPQNIMIDREGNARIMDFGIARTIRSEEMTKEGAIIGTPEYMSPEQVNGEKADQRSDIYSLGVVLYEMLTGRAPFAGETPFSIAVKHRDVEPVDPQTLNPQIPEGLSQVILKCLEKDKDRRFQTAQDLSEALEVAGTAAPSEDKTLIKKNTKTILPKSPIKAALPHKIGETKVSKKTYLPVLAISLIALAAVVIIIGYLWMKRTKAPEVLEAGIQTRGQWQNSIAVLPFRDFSPSNDQEYFCNGMTDAIIGKLYQISKLKVISLTSVLAYKDTERNIKKIGEELGVNTILEGTIQRENNRIRLSAQLINVADDSHLWADTFDREVASLFEVQDEVSRAIAEALKVEFLPEGQKTSHGDLPKNMEAYEYYLKGMNFIKSKYIITFREEDFQAGIEMFHKALEIDAGFAQVYFGLGWAYEHHFIVTQRAEDSIELQKMAETGYKLDPNSPLLNAALGYVIYTYQRDFDRAFALLKKALELNPNIGEVNFLVGTCYLYHGLYEQGIEYLTKAVELDPYYFWAPYKLAMCYTSTGKWEKAAFYFEKYFELAPDILVFPARPIGLYMKMQKPGRVEELLDETEKINPKSGAISYGRALLHASKGEKEEALALYKNSEVYSLLGMKDEAFDCLDKEIRGTVFEPYIFYYELLNNPQYNNLRNDSRFQKLLDREKKLYDENMKKYGKL